MSDSVNDIRTVLKRKRADLLKKQHVVAVGIGYKKMNNKETGNLSIICSVDRKLPKSQLGKDDVVPPLFEGIPTDVIPTGFIKAFQNPTERFRPAPGGVSVGHFQITAGTLGCWVTKNGQAYLLSNNHVLANSNNASPGDAILQPGAYDGGQLENDKLAELSEFVPITFGNGKEEENSGSCGIAGSVVRFLNWLAAASGSQTRLKQYRIHAEAENKVDCAIARPLDDNDVLDDILQLGKIIGTKEAVLGMDVIKSGRTTGLTRGKIEQTDVSVQVNFGPNRTALFTDQLMAGPMSQGGDSGSAVLAEEDNSLVGLLFAGSENSTIFNRVDNVFSALGVGLP